MIPRESLAPMEDGSPTKSWIHPRHLSSSNSMSNSLNCSTNTCFFCFFSLRSSAALQQ